MSRFKVTFFAVFALLAMSTSGLASDLSAMNTKMMSDNLVLTAPTLESLFGHDWKGFFRDYRIDDNSFPLSARFHNGSEGGVLGIFTYKFGDAIVQGQAFGNIVDGALVLVDKDPIPAYTYILKHFTNNVLVGEIWGIDEDGESFLTGDIYLTHGGR